MLNKIKHTRCRNCSAELKALDVSYEISIALQHDQTEEQVIDLINEYGCTCYYCNRERGMLNSMLNDYEHYDNYPI